MLTIISTFSVCLIIGAIIGVVVAPKQTVQYVHPPQAEYTTYYRGYTIYYLNESWRLYPHNPPVYVAVNGDNIIANGDFPDLLADIDEAMK